MSQELRELLVTKKPELPGSCNALFCTVRAVSFLAVPEARGSICHVHQLLCANFCSDPAKSLQLSHLSHYHILAFLYEFPLCLDDGLQELDVLNVPAVGLDAVDEVLHHALVDLAAELEVVHENVLHCHCFQDLREKG